MHVYGKRYGQNATKQLMKINDDRGLQPVGAMQGMLKS